MKKIVILFTALIISCSLKAQIPNSGFETWDSVGSYIVPSGWDNLDSMTSPLSIFTCEKGTPGYPGTGYLKLTSRTTTIGVAPGIAVSGKLDFSTMPPTPKSGFAYNLRPANLTGSWQHMRYGSDQEHIVIFLSKWDSALSRRDTISFTSYAVPTAMVMSWASFSIPLTYSLGSFPDSAMILFNSSGLTPVNNSFLYIDNIAFTGTVPSEVSNIPNLSLFSSVYPNPTNSNTTLIYNSANNGQIKITVNDICGRNMLTLTPKTIVGDNLYQLNVSDFAKGVYFIKIIDGQNTQVHRLIIE